MRAGGNHPCSLRFESATNMSSFFESSRLMLSLYIPLCMLQNRGI
jgi:hypothetical protein